MMMPRLTSLVCSILGWLVAITFNPLIAPAAGTLQPKQQPPPQGPFLHKVLSATSSDGLNWTPDNRVLLDHASVPAAIVTPGGAIRIYYVDASVPPETANVAESTDGGETFKVLGLKINGLSSRKALDPCIVRLRDGRYRLYYLASEPGDTTNPHRINSAISTDGVNFTEEQTNLTYPGLVDPDIFKRPKEWLMYVFSATDGKTIVARSRDGLNFTYLKPFEIQGFGTTAPIKLSDGRYRLYAFNQRGQRTFVSFISNDALTWTQEPGIRLEVPEGQEITDPYVVRLPNGTWKMFYKFQDNTQSQGPANYFLSFHACDPAQGNCNDPRTHKTYLAQSSNAINWSPVPNWQPIPGSVPDVIRRGNKLYVFTASSEVTRYNLDTQTLEPPARVTINGLETGFVDPSLFVDDQGRLILFFLRGQPGGDPAQCASGQTTCENYFDSATEVDGSDGTAFTLDSGHRAVVELGGSDGLRTASDPDIFFDGRQFVLYISHGPSISVWTASTLHDGFTKVGLLSNGTGGIPSGYFDQASGKYWTFSHIIQNGRAVIRRAIHADFSHPLTETDWTTVLTGAGLGLGDQVNVESPGFAVNSNAQPPNPSDEELTFVPDAGIRMDYAANALPGVDASGSIYLYYNDQQSRRELLSISTDGLTFPPGTQPTSSANDPRRTLLPDGTWRKYQFDLQRKEMRSQFSTDGLIFRPEDGVRYLPQPADNNTLGVYDVFSETNGQVTMLYIGDLMGLNNVRQAVSTDNGRTFVFERDNVLGDATAGGGPNSYVDQKSIQLPDGRRRLFVMKKGVIYSFIRTADTSAFSLEPGTRLSPSDFTDISLISLHDPLVVRLPDGRFRMYVAGAVAGGDRQVIVSATTTR
ncbi:MAG: hypothetical protein HY774_06510 [Acidobacteria bacterium]|nr:hypothetical protein [Acidobacteriota bacterium]